MASFFPQYPTETDISALEPEAREEFLHIIFTLDKAQLSGYPKFVLLTDVFLRLTGRARFSIAEEWSCYQRLIPALARLGESFPNIRFIAHPEIYPVEFEILDLGRVSSGECALCGERLLEKPSPGPCSICGEAPGEAGMHSLCHQAHRICNSCFTLHFSEPGCDHVRRTGHCLGKACSLIR